MNGIGPDTELLAQLGGELSEHRRSLGADSPPMAGVSLDGCTVSIGALDINPAGGPWVGGVLALLARDGRIDVTNTSARSVLRHLAPSLVWSGSELESNMLRAIEAGLVAARS